MTIDRGLTGSTGLQGFTGPAGAPGTTWLTGNGVPTAGFPYAYDGDHYLNTLNGDYYLWSTQYVIWTLVGNLKGGTGAAGSIGAAGTNGTNGTNGAIGATGPIGPTGATGAGFTFGSWNPITANTGYSNMTGYGAPCWRAEAGGIIRLAGAIRADSPTPTVFWIDVAARPAVNRSLPITILNPTIPNPYTGESFYMDTTGAVLYGATYQTNVILGLDGVTYAL